jgi:hypothetical protein
MPDEEIWPQWAAEFVGDTSRLIATTRAEAPPLVIASTVQAARPYVEILRDTLAATKMFRQAQADISCSWSTDPPPREPLISMDDIQAMLSDTSVWRVPTAVELAEADQALRTQVLPQTTGDELQEAVSRIPADPTKLELAAVLTRLAEQATGVPGSAPWVVFLVVFCVALRTDPDVVGAVAVALAVLALMQNSKPGG